AVELCGGAATFEDVEFVKETDSVRTGLAEFELEEKFDPLKGDGLTAEGVGKFYKVGVCPEVVGIVLVDDVDEFEIKGERGRGRDSVHIEIQVGGEGDVVRCRSRCDGAVKVVESPYL